MKQLTVAALIEALSKFPPDALCLIQVDGYELDMEEAPIYRAQGNEVIVATNE